MVERFIAAFEAGDVEAILTLLTEDATFTMPPYAGWYQGRASVGDSWLMPSGPAPRLRYVTTSANGQLALGVYLHDPDDRWLPLALDVLTLRGDRIADVIAFRTPELFDVFGLPPSCPRVHDPDRIPEVRDATQTVIVMCDEGYASSIAAASLPASGFRNATDLDGGHQARQAAGLPTTPFFLAP